VASGGFQEPEQTRAAPRIALREVFGRIREHSGRGGEGEARGRVSLDTATPRRSDELELHRGRGDIAGHDKGGGGHIGHEAFSGTRRRLRKHRSGPDEGLFHDHMYSATRTRAHRTRRNGARTHAETVCLRPYTAWGREMWGMFHEPEGHVGASEVFIGPWTAHASVRSGEHEPVPDLHVDIQIENDSDSTCRRGSSTWEVSR
jgi:hypothetical protein